MDLKYFFWILMALNGMGSFLYYGIWVGIVIALILIIGFSVITPSKEGSLTSMLFGACKKAQQTVWEKCQGR